MTISRESGFIILPIHNRKQMTLRCLERLEQLGDLKRFNVVVVDDGSIDGSSEAIQALYPDVIVLQGDGNLWWTGAICKGMEYAYRNGANFFIWLNDDTLPTAGTIALMVQTCQQNDHKIVTAQCYETDDLETPTYGGQRKHHLSVRLLHTPPAQTLPCDCMSGNLVCLPRSIVETIGYPPNDTMPHCLADIVYTWEAKKAGYDLEVLGDATAVCAFNPLEEGWASSEIPMRSRWQLLTTPKSNLYPSAYWCYCQSFYGKFAIVPFVQVYIRLIFFTALRWILPLKLVRQVKQFKDKLLTR
jgi:GT2 family glycosyltransferase